MFVYLLKYLVKSFAIIVKYTNVTTTTTKTISTFLHNCIVLSHQIFMKHFKQTLLIISNALVCIFVFTDY